MDNSKPSFLKIAETSREIEEQAKDLDLSSLEKGFTEGENLVDPDQEEENQGQTYKQAIISRNDFELGEYPTLDQWLNWMNLNWDKPTQHIYSKDLRVNGHFVRDSFEKYLKDSRVQIGEDGQIVRNEDGTIKGFFQSSDLKKAGRTPRHLFFALNDLLPEKEKKSHFELGTFMHEAILEPTKFRRVVVEPKASLASHDGCDILVKFWTEKLLETYELEDSKIPAKDRLESTIELIKDQISYDDAKPKVDHKKGLIEGLKTAAGLESVSEEHYSIIKVIELNLKSYGNGIIPRIIKHCKRECSAYLKDYKGTGIPLKVRPDGLQFAENIGLDAIISVKTTKAQNLSKFIYDFAQYDYDLSDGMYMETLSEVTDREFRTIITIMCQTVEPYGVAVFFTSAEDRELGKHRFLRSLDILENTIQKQIWDGYDIYAPRDNHGVIELVQPWWAFKRLEATNQEGLEGIRISGEDYSGD
jgi:hypothetical protein